MCHYWDLKVATESEIEETAESDNSTDADGQPVRAVPNADD